MSVSLHLFYCILPVIISGIKSVTLLKIGDLSHR